MRIARSFRKSVPRKIEQLDAMPRLDNGKTNMRALAERITAAAQH